VPSKRLCNRVGTRIIKSTKSKECGVFRSEETLIYISDTLIVMRSNRIQIEVQVEPCKPGWYNSLNGRSRFHFDADMQMFTIYELDGNDFRILDESRTRKYWNFQKVDKSDFVVRQLATVSL